MKKPKERLKIQQTQRLDLYSFEGSLPRIKSSIEGLIEDGWEGISIEYDYDNPYSTSPIVYLELYKNREETDKEYAKRLKDYESYKQKQKEEKVKQEERERALLQKLKEKYND